MRTHPTNHMEVSGPGPRLTCESYQQCLDLENTHSHTWLNLNNSLETWNSRTPPECSRPGTLNNAVSRVTFQHVCINNGLLETDGAKVPTIIQNKLQTCFLFRALFRLPTRKLAPVQICYFNNKQLNIHENHHIPGLTTDSLGVFVEVFIVNSTLVNSYTTVNNNGMHYKAFIKYSFKVKLR